MIRKISGRAWTFLLAAMMVVTFAFNAAPAFADGETIAGSTSFAGLEGEATPVDDVQITATGNPTLPVRLNVTYGTLSMTTTTGLVFDGPSSGSTLEFSGALNDINAALETLTYARSSAGTDALEVSLVDPGEVFFPGNNHLYEYVAVPGGISWTDAQTAAAAREKYGSSGYLATITSQEENNFVSDRLLGAGWMGASDTASEGDWKWVTGPENTTSFWSGAVAGSPVEGRYNNWADGEPNDFNFDEDCGQFLASGTGEWNDLPCSGHTLSGYVVEYGAVGDLPHIASHEATIHTLRQLKFDSPVSDTLANTVNLDFTLHSVPQTGSLKLIFHGGTARQITLADLGAGQHTFSIDPANVLASPNVTGGPPGGVLPDDNYAQVRLEYVDAASGYTLHQEIEDFTLDTEVPAVSILSPANNATAIALDSNLVMKFNEPVGTHSGDITIYNAGDDTVFETVSVGGGPVSGSGTDTLTVNPLHQFEAGAEYYVFVGNDAIRDISGNSYIGINNASMWSFTTLEAPMTHCEPPVSTQTTVSAACSVSPDGWGTATWEARYRQVGESDYVTIDNVEADGDRAAVQLSNLRPETDYQIEFRFTNDYGTSEWKIIEVTTADDPDNDDDGMPDVVEDAGPNNGDANGDGTPDKDQAYVTGFTNDITGKGVALEVSSTCAVVSVSMVDMAHPSVADTAYTYPNGLMDFRIDCGTPGFTATITQYYYDVTGSFTVRKYAPDTGEYMVVGGATVDSAMIDGAHVTRASYQVTDGDMLDIDASANGLIDDPAGLAAARQAVAPDTGLADTGYDWRAFVVAAVCIVLVAVVAAWYGAGQKFMKENRNDRT